MGRPERSARRAALVPEQDQERRRRARPAAGRDARRTPSGSTWRTASSMRSRSPARRSRASRRSRRSGCARWPRCSPATSSRAWRSTAARRSTAGSPRSGAASAAATPRCWSTSSRALPDDEAFGYLEKWLELAPFDRRVHERLLAALARRGRIREGEEHLAATARLFEAEGLDCAPIREAWRAARAQADGAPRGRRRRPRWRRQRAAAATTLVAAAPRRASIAVMPFVDRSAAAARARRRGRRARPRRDHPARQAAQPVRHRAGHRVRAARAARRPGGGRPDAERRLRRQRIGAAPGQAPHRDGRAGRDAHRPHRLGGDLQPASWTTRSSCSTRSATGSSRRSPARSRRSSATAPS